MTEKQLDSLLKDIFKSIPPVTSEASDVVEDIAEMNKELYDAHVKVGFTQDEALKILLTIIK